MSPNVLLNLAKKLSKSVSIGEFLSNIEEKHNKVVPESKVPMNPTCAFAIGYL